ncbi:hypothetical protein LCGC14_1343830 [marine sediment metagenome]|uniref:Histidine kinase domain-containing protein n=1 Tax=marine sediment metagenome TaxID=412755 RepID=A0A0F9KDK5_9ZZZZ
MPTLRQVSAAGSGADLRPLGRELTGSALWMVRLRWVAGAGIIIGTIVAGWLGIVTEVVELLLIGGIVVAYNVALSLLARRLEGRPAESIRALSLIQILADLVVLSGLVYFCGGIEGPLAIFYVFHVVCAAILLSPPMGYFVAAMATVLFSAVAVLQAAVPSLYHPLPQLVPAGHYRVWQHVSLELTTFAVAMFVSAYLTIAVTSRLRATEAQVGRQRDVLDSIISGMSESLVFLSPEGKVLLWNSGGGRWLLGAERGQDVQNMAEESLPKAVSEYVQRAGRADEPLPTEMFWVSGPGVEGAPPRQFRACASGVFDAADGHIGYVIVAEDLTEQLHLEQDLRAQNREVRTMSEALRETEQAMAQHEKMVAIGTMAAGVAHEIGNPLACLSAIVQLLRRRLEQDQDRAQLAALDEQINRIVTIVRELLEFAKPGTGERVLADLDRLVEQAVRMVRYSHRSRNVQLESIRSADLPKVFVTPQKFQQALLNLLLNALDAVKDLPGGGIVTVERAIEGERVCVKVVDRGIGMTPEQLRQAPEPFYTTKAPGEGTGLGLAVSYRLIEQQGGRIDIDSSPGRGTTATISFPVAMSATRKSGGPEVSEESSC